MVPTFTPNTIALQQMDAALVHCGQAAIDGVYRVVRVSAQEYKRRIQRVVPVEFGTLKNSWQVVTTNDGKEIIAEVGTNLVSDKGAPYPVYLELGTDRIAGGKVQDWKPGENPILEWPAKWKDLPNFRPEAKGMGDFAGSDGSPEFERSVKIAQRQFTVGQGEQMPFLRPIGFELAPRIVKVVHLAVTDGVKEAMKRKHFK